MHDSPGDRPERYEVKRRKPSREELEALVRGREKPLEEARKQLREQHGG